MKIQTTTFQNELDLESDSSGELSIHSSDDELDEYILASPEMIENTKRLYSMKETETNHEEFLCDQVIKTTYLALGLDLLGPGKRALRRINRSRNQFKVLGKRDLEVETEENKNLKKLKTGGKSKKKVLENRVEQFSIERSWIEKIFDDLTEMNKALLRKLKIEFKLANKSCKMIFYKTFFMLVEEFRKNHYDYSISIRDNIIRFINLLANFYQCHISPNFAFNLPPQPLNIE
jgi:hypothetical protein